MTKEGHPEGWPFARCSDGGSGGLTCGLFTDLTEGLALCQEITDQHIAGSLAVDGLFGVIVDAVVFDAVHRYVERVLLEQVLLADLGLPLACGAGGGRLGS